MAGPAAQVPAARLQALARIGGMVRDRDLAALAAAARACAALRDEVAALDAARLARAAEVAALDRPDPALITGADARWSVLSDRRRADLMRRLALARADREAAKVAALRALGRADILEKLAAPRSR